MNSRGDTALMCAIGQKQLICARALLHCTDLSITNRLGRNAFHKSVTVETLKYSACSCRTSMTWIRALRLAF